MRGLNKVTLIGNVQPNDPELKYIPNGTAVCRFKLVTSETYKDKDGNQIENAEWHRIVVWGKLAETCNTYLKKGSRIYLEGRIKTPDTYEKDGKTVYPNPEIVMESMLMLDGRPAGESNAKTEVSESAGVVSDKSSDSGDNPF
ncbi:MAG TPA: single-stranded DNA-binding protein [Ignavibacteria bacterium]|nr:single-stranded DNA-binding protein [Ignavibacteria bacterium]HRJ98048.1 single-stranded DNA-binding protein [Ignavibacteria bacterium]